MQVKTGAPEAVATVGAATAAEAAVTAAEAVAATVVMAVEAMGVAEASVVAREDWAAGWAAAAATSHLMERSVSRWCRAQRHCWWCRRH
jgi:hypothetical protein